MSNKFVRSSKFRHVYGIPTKKEHCYDNIKISKGPHESNMSAVNKKFIAVVLEGQGGGAFMVAPLTKVGRFDINYPKVSGHKNPILDLAWNPFDDNQIASCSEDATVKLWNIPDEGILANKEKDDCVLNLVGHQRKVLFVVWHPTTENVLLSAGNDHVIIIWNTSTGEATVKIPDIHGENMIHSVCWNYNGSLIATTCKDKRLRVIDPRKEEKVISISEATKGHTGSKPSKVTFCGKSNKLFSTGFSKMSDRQVALWDPTDLSKPLTLQNMDSSSGVLFPFFDEGTQIVFVVGKGDTQIKYFEVGEASVFYLSMYQFTNPIRGASIMPKREVDYMKCEVLRFYQLNIKGFVEPLSMTVPRKSEMFQDDIYPPCQAGKPAMKAEDWFGGVDKDPFLLRFTDEGLVEMSLADSQVGKNLREVKMTAAKKDPSVLKRFGSPQPEGMPVTLEEYRKAYRELLEENAKLKARIAELEGKN